VASDALADRLWDLVLARGLAEGEAKVLLVVDQLEELLRADPGERERFAALVALLQNQMDLRSQPAYISVAVRRSTMPRRGVPNREPDHRQPGPMPTPPTPAHPPPTASPLHAQDHAIHLPKPSH
jgi:hypothetical protein